MHYLIQFSTQALDQEGVDRFHEAQGALCELAHRITDDMYQSTEGTRAGYCIGAISLYGLGLRSKFLSDLLGEIALDHPGVSMSYSQVSVAFIAPLTPLPSAGKVAGLKLAPVGD